MTDEVDAELRKSIDKLIRVLLLRVVENDALKDQLIECEQTIAQLQATIEQLRAELHRGRIGPRRLSAIARTGGALLMNAAVSFGGGAGGTLAAQAFVADAPSRPAIEISGDVGGDIRIAIEECDRVAAQADEADRELGSRNERLAERVRDLMAARDMSRQDLAKASGVANSTVRYILESQGTDVKVETLDKLAKGFGVPLTEITKVL